LAKTVIAAAVDIARKARGSLPVPVALDVGPLGEMLEPRAP
jgi:hypothetical protein